MSDEGPRVLLCWQKPRKARAASSFKIYDRKTGAGIRLSPAALRQFLDHAEDKWADYEAFKIEREKEPKNAK